MAKKIIIKSQATPNSIVIKETKWGVNKVIVIKSTDISVFKSVETKRV